MITVFEIKSEYKEELRNWGKYLATSPEAIETLKEEKVSRELLCLFDLDNRSFLIGFSEFFDKPQKADLSKEINKKHRALLDKAIIKRIKPETLYDICYQHKM